MRSPEPTRALGGSGQPVGLVRAVLCGFLMGWASLGGTRLTTIRLSQQGLPERLLCLLGAGCC